MNCKSKQIPKEVWLIVGIITVLKLFLASYLSLSNDEVYYHTYALYPALSHFDHPPMVGWIIQLFTFNMQLHNDFFMRLGAVVFSIFNSLIVFKFTNRLSGKKVAIFSLIVFNLSFYNAIIAGFFIMPDTGVLTFWLLAISYFHKSLTPEEITTKERKLILIAGILVGVAMLSKYHAGLLWVSAFLFIILYRRKWLLEPSFYIAGVLTALVFTPVIIWNFQNHFISFAFHGDRVNLIHQGFNFLYFGRELFGQMLYTNVVIFGMIVWSLIYYLKHFSSRSINERFLIYFGIPTIFLFLFISVFKSTLPHWSGPGYATLILFAAITFSNTNQVKDVIRRRFLLWAIMTFFLACVAVIVQLEKNVIPLGFKNDPTADVTGWDELGEKFTELRTKHLSERKISKNHVMLHYRWFPAAHYDYYLAEPNQIPLIVSGDIDYMHKYLWINEERGGIAIGEDAYYLTTDIVNHSAKYMYGYSFEEISKPEIIVIHRNNKPYIFYYLYILHRYNGNSLYDKDLLK